MPAGQDLSATWDQIAPAWDAKMGEGGAFQRHMLGPVTEALLEVEPGQSILDVGCGNGAFSRRLAALGARVVAIDFSERFLELAKGRTVENSDRIEYRRVDVTNEGALVALGEARFDAAVAAMVLMDLAEIRPLFSALRVLLRPRGRFVFSVMHPCFNHSGASKVAEEQERDGRVTVSRAVKVTAYLSIPPTLGLGIAEQPVPHTYFHRSLETLLGEAFRAGFVLDALREPAFPEPEPDDGTFSWSRFQEIPPVLLARLRLI